MSIKSPFSSQCKKIGTYIGSKTDFWLAPILAVANPKMARNFCPFWKTVMITSGFMFRPEVMNYFNLFLKFVIFFPLINHLCEFPLFIIDIMFWSLLVALISRFLLIFATISAIAFNFFDSTNSFWFPTQTCFLTGCRRRWWRFCNSRLWVWCDANSRLRRWLDIFFLETCFWRWDQNWFSGNVWLTGFTDRARHWLAGSIIQSEFWVQVENSIYREFFSLDIFFFEPLKVILAGPNQKFTDRDFGPRYLARSAHPWAHCVLTLPQHLQYDSLRPSW